MKFFNNLPYKTKNKILLASLLVLAVLAYTQAIQKSISLYFENQELKQQLQQSGNAPENILLLETKLASLNGRLGMSDSVTQNREYVLQKVTEFCQKNALTLVDFPQSVFIESNEYLIETKAIEVRGGFINLVKLVYSIETEYSLGRIASLRFFMKKDNVTKRQLLSCNIVLQNIKPN